MDLAYHLWQSLRTAETEKFEKDPLIAGMSGKQGRHAINRILSVPGLKYLEIGVWAGSTFCSALNGNEIDAIAIDNWTEYGGPAAQFKANVERFKGKNTVRIIEDDCFKPEVIASIRDIDVYFYDGWHSEEDQCKALTLYKDCMKDTFIFYVDDWNWPNVSEGTKRGIREAGLKVLFEKEYYTGQDNPNTKVVGAQDSFGFWNGMAFYVLKKV